MVLAPPVSAQLRPEPDSPAGAEYRFPLDSAREEAAGRGGDSRGPGSSPGGPGQDAPLFGEGIEPPGGGSAREPGAAGANERPRPGSGKADRAARGEADAPERGASALSRSAADTPDGVSDLLIPGLALMVLLAGGAIGLLLRRVR